MADGNGDITGLVNDPRFSQLSPADQRQALAGVTGNASFNSLGDGEVLQFVSRLRQPPMPKPPNAIEQQEFQNPRSPNFTGQLPGFEGSYSSGDTGKAAAMSGAGLVAGTALGGTAAVQALPKAIPAAIGGAKAIGAWAKANPVQAYIVYQLLHDTFKGTVNFLKNAPTGELPIE